MDLVECIALYGGGGVGFGLSIHSTSVSDYPPATFVQ